MKHRNEIITRPSTKPSMSQRLAGWLLRLDDRPPIVRMLVQGFYKILLIDMKYGVSRRLAALICSVCIVITLVGVDGWTDRKELRFLLIGLLLLAVTAWTMGIERRAMFDYYGNLHGGITEWRNMVFDIRESYLNMLHLVLENKFPGITIYGRYKDHANHSQETEHAVCGESKSSKWENRPGKYLTAICWMWTNDEKEVRLEYRRAPGNIYASRFLQTKSLSDSQHNDLKTTVDQNEWSCEPQFSWLCRLGISKIIIISVFLMTALLWGGRETVETILKTNVTSNEIMTYARWTFFEAGAAAIGSLVLVFARKYYFPAGVFRIDEEKNVQETREKSRSKTFKWVVGVLSGIAITMATTYLTTTCSSSVGGTTGMGDYLRQTNVCQLARVFGLQIEQLKELVE